MSKLRVADDDHGDAAGKHLADAQALVDAARFDGAGYLSGYVVECALKAVILHERSFNPTTGLHDATVLATEHAALSRRPFGHDLTRLLGVTITPTGASYVPFIPSNAALIRDWKETLRYRPPGTVSETRARSYFEWACTVYEQSVLRMKLDGVI